MLSDHRFKGQNCWKRDLPTVVFSFFRNLKSKFISNYSFWSMHATWKMLLQLLWQFFIILLSSWNGILSKEEIRKRIFMIAETMQPCNWRTVHPYSMHIWELLAQEGQKFIFSYSTRKGYVPSIFLFLRLLTTFL